MILFFNIQKYDKQLAEEAQKVADTCEFKHKEIKDSK